VVIGFLNAGPGPELSRFSRPSITEDVNEAGEIVDELRLSVSYSDATSVLTLLPSVCHNALQRCIVGESSR
jgi:hypothetical protein